MTHLPTKPWASLNWPNRISIMRLMLVAPFVVAMQYQQQYGDARYAAIALFVAMGVSDALDGFLARRMGLRSRLGAILDPLADKVMIICAAVLLALPDSCIRQAPLASYVVVAIVGKDLWVMAGFLVIYLVTDSFKVRPTRAGKFCTFVQICLVAVTLLAPDLDRLYARLGERLSWACGWAVVATCVAAAVSYTRLGLTFIHAEQKPLEEPNGGKRN